MRKKYRELGGERERGAGTVQALGYFFALIVLFFALANAAAIIQAKHHAQAGADLGAIAGAQAINRGESHGFACAYAERVTRGNKAELLSCDIAGESVTLQVQSQPILSALPAVRARAIAAPEEYQKN